MNIFQMMGRRLINIMSSDHSIYTRGANREVYQFLTDFLTEHWGKPVNAKLIDYA